jgi:predicted PurR-regulated permease PerM
MQTLSSPPPPRLAIRSALSDYFLLAVLIIVLAGAGSLLIPFAGALISALVIGIGFYPTHQRIGRWLHRRSPSLHALITDILVVLFLVLPTVLLIWVVSNEANSITPALKEWGTTVENLREGKSMENLGSIRDARDWFSDRLGVRPSQFRRQVVRMADNAMRSISAGIAGLAKNSVKFLFSLLVMLLSLFFFFRDGRKMLTTAEEYLPLRPELQRQLVHSVRQTTLGIIRGWFVTALFQGVTAALGYAIVGVPAVALFGVLTAVTGLVPSIGTALVWLPLSVYYLMQHELFKGIFLLLWGTLVVGVLDNFLRPYLVGDRADLPFISLFFAILGGIEVFGTKGVFLGPILFAIAPVLLAEYKHRYVKTS